MTPTDTRSKLHAEQQLFTITQKARAVLVSEDTSLGDLMYDEAQYLSHRLPQSRTPHDSFMFDCGTLLGKLAYERYMVVTGLEDEGASAYTEEKLVGLLAHTVMSSERAEATVRDVVAGMDPACAALAAKIARTRGQER